MGTASLYQKSSKIRTISFKDDRIRENLFKKMTTMREYSDKEYYSPIICEEIIRELDLQNDFWKNFTNQIFYHLRENGFVVVKKLPFDENNRLLVGLSSIIGTLHEPYATENTHMVREQTPGEVIYDQDAFPHTDSAHWPEPHDLTALQCVHKDEQGGGLSRIVHVDDVLQEFQNEGQSKLIKYFLETDIPFLLHKNFEGKGWNKKKVLTESRFGTQVRFARTYIEKAIENHGIEVDPQLLKNVKIFEEVATKIGEKTQFSLEEGDWLIFDNHRVIHSRTNSSRTSKRLLKKVKMKIERNKIFENLAIPESKS